MRFYDSSGFPIVEIGYHAEPNLTGNRHDKVISMDAHKKFKSEKYSVMQFYRLHYAVFFGQSINDSAQLSVLLFYEHCTKVPGYKIILYDWIPIDERAQS